MPVVALQWVAARTKMRTHSPSFRSSSAAGQAAAPLRPGRAARGRRLSATEYTQALPTQAPPSLADLRARLMQAASKAFDPSPSPPPSNLGSSRLGYAVLQSKGDSCVGCSSGGGGSGHDDSDGAQTCTTYDLPFTEAGGDAAGVHRNGRMLPPVCRGVSPSPSNSKWGCDGRPLYRVSEGGNHEQSQGRCSPTGEGAALPQHAFSRSPSIRPVHASVSGSGGWESRHQDWNSSKVYSFKSRECDGKGNHSGVHLPRLLQDYPAAQTGAPPHSCPLPRLPGALGKSCSPSSVDPDHLDVCYTSSNCTFQPLAVPATAIAAKQQQLRRQLQRSPHPNGTLLAELLQSDGCSSTLQSLSRQLAALGGSNSGGVPLGSSSRAAPPAPTSRGGKGKRALHDQRKQPSSSCDDDDNPMMVAFMEASPWGGQEFTGLHVGI